MYTLETFPYISSEQKNNLKQLNCGARKGLAENSIENKESREKASAIVTHSSVYSMILPLEADRPKTHVEGKFTRPDGKLPTEYYAHVCSKYRTFCFTIDRL